MSSKDVYPCNSLPHPTSCTAVWEVREATPGDGIIKVLMVQVDIPFVPWANVSAAPPVDFDFAPRKFHMTCCNKDADSDNVDFSQCKPEPMVYEREMQSV